MFFSPNIAARFLRLTIALLVASVPSLCRAQHDRVTIGPGLLTFPEIAQAVSTPTKRVECAPRVRHRAAFLYLKERPRAEAMKILAKGLDVVFQYYLYLC